jgi:hypothetical protein
MMGRKLLDAIHKVAGSDKDQNVQEQVEGITDAANQKQCEELFAALRPFRA